MAQASMRTSICAALLAGALLLVGCVDPFGQEREGIVSTISRLQQECDDLRRIVGETTQYGVLSTDLRTRLTEDGETLAALEECTACAARLQSVAEANPPRTMLPEPKPYEVGNVSKKDPLNELIAKKETLTRYRDSLRNIAEDRDRWERLIEGLNEGLNEGMAKAWTDPSCAPPPCQAVLEARGR